MRILIYGINYAPEVVGSGKFTGEMAEWFAEQGHEVRVVVPPPYYPTWTVKKIYKTGYSCQGMRGVKVYRCPIWVKRELTGWQRILHLLSFAISSFPVLIRQIFWRPEMVMAIEPSFVCVPAALLVAKICQAKSWLHIQDFEIDAGFGLGMVPNIGWVRSSLLTLEKRLFEQFHQISTISEAMLAHLHSKGAAIKHAFLFPNWVDTTEIYPLPQSQSLRFSLGLSAEKVIVLYAGSIANKQPLEHLLEAAKCLHLQSELHFIIAGEGPKKASLMKLARSLNLKNVTFLPLLPVKAFNRLLSTADIHVLIQHNSLANFMMPSKLLGMMASGRPTIATAEANSAIASEISRSKGGICIPPNQPEKLISALQYLSNNIHERAVLGRNSRAYAEKHLSKEAILNNVCPLRQSAGNWPSSKISTSSSSTRNE
ncbi:WcaI family glycosyltransferase [Altericista sp. CCNU0014]|uniref:WcaI family glycosyltransferase n=1 Tax=Altericista sp. CCNU0014 TaxID=3082949 RepID=UPI00384AE886